MSSEFRKGKPVDKPVRRLVDKSHYLEEATSGSTLYATIVPFTGKIINFQIYIKHIDTDITLPARIEIESERTRIHRDELLSLGTNSIQGFSVDNGDIISVRFKGGFDFKAEVVVISFQIKS